MVLVPNRPKGSLVSLSHDPHGRAGAWLAGKREFPKGCTWAFREVARQTPPTAPPGRYRLGARASRPHPLPLAAAQRQCDAAGSHPVGGNSSGQAEGEPWRRSRLIQVGGGRGCAGLGAGGTPALPGSLHPMTSSHQGHKIVEAFGCRLWLKEVHLYSCPFVVHLY